MLSLAILLAILFIAGGIMRLGSGLRQMSQARGWLNIIIGLLDLFIAYLLVGNGPIVSVTLIATLVGIELLFSSFGLIAAASVLKRIINRIRWRGQIICRATSPFFFPLFPYLYTPFQYPCLKNGTVFNVIPFLTFCCSLRSL